MLVAGTREWGIMASLPFPFVIGLARPGTGIAMERSEMIFALLNDNRY